MAKAQSSFEFLNVIAIGFTLIALITGVFMIYSTSAKQELDRNQVDRIFNEVMDNVERIYFLGNGNRVTMRVNLPSGIQNISIHQQSNIVGDLVVNFSYINITMISADQIVENLYLSAEPHIRFNCSYSCEGNGNSRFYPYYHINSGVKEIRIHSRGSFVEIDFVEKN